MTRSRIILYVIASLLTIGATFLIIYSSSQGEADPIEPLSDTTSEVEISSPEEVSLSPEKSPAKVESEIPPTLPPSKPILNPEPKHQDQKVPLPQVKTEITPVTFDSSAMLAAHNAVRNAVNIDPLTYSHKLAQSAQKWSDELQANNCLLQHDYATPYGENLYWGSRTSSSNTGLAATPAIVVNAWTSEAKDYNYSKNSCSAAKICGHYTQVVWEETTEVGCGVSMCRKGKTQSEVWVCRYNPPGNFVGEKPY